MEKRTCNKCNKDNYSDDSHNIWVCCHCGATMVKNEGIERPDLIQLKK